MVLLKNMNDESVDLILTSPPYCMNKAYEKREDDIKTFVSTNKEVLSQAVRILKKGGSLCWQTGYHVAHEQIVPLDYLIFSIIDEINQGLSNDQKMILHNRIIWSFGHGLNSEKRFSGRHETVLWFTKGPKYFFDIDPIRIPQKYPGKKYTKGPRAGQYSGNVHGKNPSDVWEIPNVKANHVEKTDHPCQFPVALAARLVKSLTKPGDVVLDPFLGSGTSAVASIVNGRKFIGAEIKPDYCDISVKRIKNSEKGTERYRPDVPVCPPDPNSSVAKKPDTFAWKGDEQ